MASFLFSLARSRGLSPQRALEFVNAAYSESGLNPSIRNKSSGATGLFQLLSSGYVNKANAMGGTTNPRANALAILPNYLSYWRSHPNAAPGQAAAAVEASGEGPGFYSGALGMLSGAVGRSGGAPSFVPPGQTGVAPPPTPVTSSGLNPRALLASALITANQASSQGRPADYSMIAQLVNAARQPAPAPQAPQVQVPTGTIRSSGTAGGFLPAGASYKPGRADQGRDFQTAPGGAVIAPGDGVVVAVKSDPHGFGPSYPIVRFVSGPYAGKTLYIGHTLSAVRPGQRVRSGQVISRTGTRPVGNASTPGWGEIGYAPGGNPGSFGQRTPF